MAYRSERRDSTLPHKRGGRQGTHDHEDQGAETRESTETKSAHKTTELIVYVLGVAGVLIAAALVADASFESFRVSEKGAVSKNRGLAFLARTTRSVFRGWRVRCNSYARRDKVRSWATWKRSRKR